MRAMLFLINEPSLKGYPVKGTSCLDRRPIQAGNEMENGPLGEVQRCSRRDRVQTGHRREIIGYDEGTTGGRFYEYSRFWLENFTA